MAKILVTDGMAAEGISMLQEAGHEVHNKKLNAQELLGVIGQYDALVVRSATQVTADVLAAGAPRLQVVGRAGVGVDNVDVPTATKRGILVMNAPMGNILSAAEHTVGMIFAAARMIAPAHEKMVKGVWDKKTFIGVELCSRTLGIVGLGKIGRHVAKVMQAVGMDVIAYDPFLTPEVAKALNITAVDLDELITRADFITLHTPLTPETRNMINAESIAKMKPGVRIINVARGGIIDEAALAQALKDGKVGAAALDVFGNEPLEAGSPLIAAPRITITPHLGASTEEAQVRVSTDIARSFNAYFADGTIIDAVNVHLKVDKAIAGYLPMAERLGRALAQALQAPIKTLEVKACAGLATHDIRPLAVAALKGVLDRISETPVNYVNAGTLAQERGITLTTAVTESVGRHGAHLILTAKTEQGERLIGGTVLDGLLYLQILDGYDLDLPMGQHLLVLEYPDRPGMVGKFGTILGAKEINIARMEVSRIDGRGEAMVVLTLDDPVPAAVTDEIRKAIHATRAFGISL